MITTGKIAASNIIYKLIWLSVRKNRSENKQVIDVNILDSGFENKQMKNVNDTIKERTKDMSENMVKDPIQPREKTETNSITIKLIFKNNILKEDF